MQLAAHVARAERGTARIVQANLGIFVDDPHLEARAVETQALALGDVDVGQALEAVRRPPHR